LSLNSQQFSILSWISWDVHYCFFWSLWNGLVLSFVGHMEFSHLEGGIQVQCSNLNYNSHFINVSSSCFMHLPWFLKHQRKVTMKGKLLVRKLLSIKTMDCRKYNVFFVTSLCLHYFWKFKWNELGGLNWDNIPRGA